MTTSSDRIVPDKRKLASPKTGRRALLTWAFPIDAGGFIVDLHVRWPLAMDDHVVNRGNCRGHIHIVKGSSLPFQGIAEADSITGGWHSTPVEDMGKKHGSLRKCLVRNAQFVLLHSENRDSTATTESNSPRILRKSSPQLIKMASRTRHQNAFPPSPSQGVLVSRPFVNFASKYPDKSVDLPAADGPRSATHRRFQLCAAATNFVDDRSRLSSSSQVPPPSAHHPCRPIPSLQNQSISESIFCPPIFILGNFYPATPVMASNKRTALPFRKAACVAPSPRLAGFGFPLKDYAAKHGKTWLPR